MRLSARGLMNLFTDVLLALFLSMLTFRWQIPGSVLIAAEKAEIPSSKATKLSLHISNHQKPTERAAIFVFASSS